MDIVRAEMRSPYCNKALAYVGQIALKISGIHWDKLGILNQSQNSLKNFPIFVSGPDNMDVHNMHFENWRAPPRVPWAYTD